MDIKETLSLGFVDSLYYNLFLFCKQNRMFDATVQLNKYDRLSILIASLNNSNVDVICADPSLLLDYNDYECISPFILNSHKIFAHKNFFSKNNDKNYCVIIGVPHISSYYKSLGYIAVRQHQVKSKNVKFVEYKKDDFLYLLDSDLVDLIIVMEPDSFKILNKNSATILPLSLKPPFIVSLVFIVKKNINNEKKHLIDKLKNSLLQIIHYLVEENGFNQFFITSPDLDKYCPQKYQTIFQSNIIKNIVHDSAKFHNEICESVVYVQKANSAQNNNLLQKNTVSDRFAIKAIISAMLERRQCSKISQNTEQNLLIELANDLLYDFLIAEGKYHQTLHKEHRLENELMDSNSSLSRLFMQLKDTSEKVIIKNIQAKEAIESKSKFFSSITHDLRTPLTGILSITELLLRKFQNDPDIYEKLSMVNTSGETLLRLINDLLAVSKQDFSRVTLTKKIFNFRQTIKDVESNIAAKLSNQNVVFTTIIDDKIPEVLFGDAIKIEQILFNILGNSVKFTESGHIRLRIGIVNKNEKNITLEFIVEDSGIGIDEDKIEYIFQPYRQENDSINKKYGGTGLGLSIVKELVELMDGSIQCKSKKGEGTQFFITSVFEIPTLKSGEKIDDKSVKMDYYTYVFKNARILILEDNQINQVIIKDYFKDFNGLEYDLATNGEEGLSLLDNGVYDLVLSDINMPIMNGKDFCLLARKKHKTLPIVALTAYDDEEEFDALRRCGFTNILQKPYDQSKLVNTLSSFINIIHIEVKKDKLESIKDVSMIETNKPQEKNVFKQISEIAEKSKTIKEIQKIFINELEKRFMDFSNAIEKKDSVAMQFFCHNLKGIAPSVGYSEFADFAYAISPLYKEAKWEELKPFKEKYIQLVTNIYENLKNS